MTKLARLTSLVAIGLALRALLLGQIQPAMADPIPESGIAAARQWFRQEGVELSRFRDMPLEEAAKRLTSAVYSFCANGSAPSDLNELFIRCNAACGGYSYVLRGLLEALGADTRYANLLNIPNQGNHTGVEVHIGDRWGYFDPTFGAFFTDDGTAGGKTLSLRTVSQVVPLGRLEPLVLQAAKQKRDFASLPLDQLFDRRFDHKYMVLENYQLAEATDTQDAGSLISLDIPLEIRAGRASFGWIGEPGALDAMQQAWLEATNARLNDSETINDTSYNSSLLYNSADISRVTTISFYGLKKNQTYDLTLTLHGGHEGGRLQVSGGGKGLRFPSGVNIDVAAAAPMTLRRSFVSHRSSARIWVRNQNVGGVVYLLGVSVSEPSPP